MRLPPRAAALPAIEILRRRPLLCVIALALLLAFTFQGTRGLWEPDEGRYTNVALQMLRTGDFISLRRNEESLHFTKPPLTYWAIAGSVRLLGRNEWAVRLPMALAFVLTVGLVYQMGRRFVPDKPWLPALVYATSPLPFLAANAVTTDTALAATEALAVFCYVRERFGGGNRAWLDAMWTAFGLAFLTKGPPALLPLLAIIAFEISQRRGLRLLRPIGLLGFALVGLGWFVVVIRLHPGLLDYFLGHEVYARIATAELHRFPQWYGPFLVYLPTLLFGALPWLPFALPAAANWFGARTTLSDETRFLLAWLALPLLVFCLSRSRLPLYLLPLFVPFALLIGRAMSGLRWNRGVCVALGLWVVLLISLKYAVSVYASEKDGRLFAAQLAPMLPGHPEEFLFVEDMTRNSLNLYFDSDIERLSFKPMPRQMSDSSYDQTVADELRENKTHRVFIMKREVERYFLNELRSAGKTPVLLGAIHDLRSKAHDDHVVYTLAGEFPEAVAPRKR